MNIPLPLIIFVLGLFGSIITGVVVFVFSSIKSLKDGIDSMRDIFTDIKVILASSKATEEIKVADCSFRHTYIKEKFIKQDTLFGKYDERIKQLEKL